MFLPIIPIFLTSQAPVWEAIANWYQNSLIHQLLTYLEEKYFSVDFHVYEHIALGPEAGDAAQMLIIGIALGLILAAIVTAYTRTKLGGFLRKLIQQDCLSEDAAKTLREVGEFRNASVRRALSRGVALKKYVRRVGDGEEKNAENASTVVENGDTVAENAADWSESVEATETPDAVAAETEKPSDGDAAEPRIDEVSAAKRGFLSRLRRFFLGDDARERIDFSTARFYIPADLTDQIDARFARRRSDVLFTILTVVAVVVCSSLLCTFLPDILQLMDNLIGMMAP